MNMILKSIFAMATIFAAAMAYAKGPVVTVGAGAGSCGSFLDSINAMAPAPTGKIRSVTSEGKQWLEEGNLYEQWLAGYVSGYNASLPLKKQVSFDMDGITQWVKHYCEENADVTLTYAVGAFIMHEEKKSQ